MEQSSVSNYPNPNLKPERYMTVFRHLHDNLLWFIKCKGIPFADVNNHRMFLHKKDSGISKELSVYKVHEPRNTIHYKEMVKSGMTVIDIGSNLGYYALISSDIVGKSGLVIAIEPQDENYNMLQKNVLNCENVTCVKCAVGDTNEDKKFYLSKRSNLHSMIKPYGYIGYTMVKTKTLDTLVSELKIKHIDIIRMDLEGYEVEVIKGMTNVLATSKPILVIETHCDVLGYDKVSEMLCLLFAFGYNVNYVIDRDKDFAYVNNNEDRIHKFDNDTLVKHLTDYRVFSIFLE